MTLIEQFSMTVKSNYHMFWLLCLAMGLKILNQFFNQWEAKWKSMTPWKCNFFCALSKLLVIARNFDWFVTLFAPVVIGCSNYFGTGFSTVIWKLLFILYIHFQLQVINYQTWGECFISISWEEGWKTRHSWVFLTNFEVFGNPMKHSFKCLI